MPARQRPEIAIDSRATLGEGPVWDEQRQLLLWLEILPGLVHRFDPATGSDDVFRVGKPVGSAGLRRSGGLVLAVEDGFALLDKDWQRVARPSSSTLGREPGSTKANAIRQAASWPAPWPMT
jgi:sugar lactone lactonase YvrE